jgi:transcriptional regulator with XRE-family HTH domain
MEALAREVGLTKGFISQLENDLTSPSVASLLRLCEVLEVPMATLFSNHPDAPLIRAAERPAIAFGGLDVEEFQLTPSSQTDFVVIQSDIAPGGGSGREPYGLKAKSEFVCVLSGELLVSLEGTSYRLAPGDSLTFGADRSRTWENPSRVTPARVLWVISPAPS